MLSGWPQLQGKGPSRRNLLSKFFFVHLYGVLRLKRPYFLDEQVPSCEYLGLDSGNVCNAAERAWNLFAARNCRFFRVVLHLFSKEILTTAILSFFQALCPICSALLINVIISDLADSLSTGSMASCFGLAAFYFLNAALQRIIHGISFTLSMKAKLMVPGLIYRRILRSNIAALQLVNHSDIFKFISEHTENVAKAFVPIHYVWLSPTIFLILLILITAKFGLVALVGYLALGFLSFIHIFMKKGMEIFSRKSIFYSDRRLKLVNEVIGAIYQIKASVWETSMAKYVDKIRNDESRFKMWQGVLEGLSVAIENPRLWLYLILLTMWTVTGEIVEAEIIFPLAYLFMISYNWFPKNFIAGINSVRSVKNSFIAIQDFLELSEADIDERVELQADAIQFSNLVYDQDSDNQSEPSFPDNDLVQARDFAGNIFDLGPNSQKLIGLSGPPGSGKTRFLMQLMGFARNESVKKIQTKDGMIGYVAEKPWLFPGTIRENILVGALYDAKRYWSVVKMCLLSEDLRQMKYGDQTRIDYGEFGLSESQQAKISLVRAMYLDTDVYIMDDPFRYMDPKTAKAIFSTCIQEFLLGKTRIIVTGDENLLSQCDHTMIFPITMGRKNHRRESATSEQSRDFERDFSANQTEDNLRLKEVRELRIWSKVQDEKSADIYTQGVTVTALEDSLMSEIGGGLGRLRKFSWMKPYSPHTFTDSMITKDRSAWKAIFRVTRTANPVFVLLLVLATCVAPAMMNISDLTLTQWANDADITSNISETDSDYATILSGDITDDGTDDINYGYLYRYIFLILLVFLLSIPLLICWRIVFLRATNKYHQRMIRAFLRAPMQFLAEKNPGAISLTFSSSVNEVDYLLISQTSVFLTNFNLLILCMVIIVFINIYTVLAFIPALIVLFIIFRVFSRAKTQLCRLLRDARIPYYTHFVTSFVGLKTVRALKLERKLLNDFHKFQNVFISVVSMYLDVSMWLDITLSLVGAYFIIGVSYSCIIISMGTHSSSTIALVLTYVMLVGGLLNPVIRDASEVRDKLKRLHSLLEYEEFPREEPDKGNIKNPAQDDAAYSDVIPLAIRDPEIKMEKIKLRYSPRSHFVLKGFNLNVGAGEKVGIVGSAGSGKTSLFNVLLRMYDFEGNVFIEGKETKLLPLSALRRAVSVLTANPVIFSLTVRDNLDPRRAATDDAIWMALERVGLKDSILNLGLGVDTQITGDIEWDHSQKFLFAVARSLLEGPRIIAVDEAIHDIPHRDVKQVLSTFEDVFSDCTVLLASRHTKLLKQTCERIISLDPKKL